MVFFPLLSNRYRVVVSYPPQSEAELELKEGDIVFVHKKREDGWFKGTLQRNGKTGLFPGSFVENIWDNWFQKFQITPYCKVAQVFYQRKHSHEMFSNDCNVNKNIHIFTVSIAQLHQQTKKMKASAGFITFYSWVWCVPCTVWFII